MHKKCAWEALQIINSRYGHQNFNKVVEGAIKDCLNSHACITKGNMTSMVKRINKQLWSRFKTILYNVLEDIEKEGNKEEL